MPHQLAYSENNVIGIIILLVIIKNMKSGNKKIKRDGTVFYGIIFSTIIIMGLNIVLDALNGQTGYLLREVHVFFTTLYFILNPIPYMLWSIYVDYYIHKSKRRIKKILPILVLPAVFSIILCLLSSFNGEVFYITASNEYRRGNLFILNSLFYYGYYVVTYIQIKIERKNLRKKDYYSLLVFGIIPFLAGIIQIINTSRSFIWLAVSLSCLIIYLNIQNSEINEDYLTGLYNRRQLDMYLRNSIRNIREDELLFMIMMDINDFKSINDTYGHIEGDKALQHTANILTDNFRSEDFISRYAGDEFVIIAKLEDESQKEKAITRLAESIEAFNESGLTPYNISVGLGYDIYNPQSKMDVEDFIKHVDKLMYEDKKRVKEALISS